MRRDRHNSYLVRLVVSHGEGKGLWEVTGGHLCSVIIRRATAGRTVEGNWNLENTEVNPVQCQRLCLDRGGSSDGEELLKSGKTGNVQQRIRIYLKAVGGRLASSPVRIHFLHHDLVRAADKQGK